MHDHKENVSNNELEESKEINTAKTKRAYWQMAALFASVIAVISLSGIWYVNNEKAFLQIENIKLEVEAENLREEVKILQTAIAQNNTSVKDTSSKPNDTPTAGTQTESSQTVGDYVNYEVKPGDTLAGISVSLFGTERYVPQIAELNGLNTESILQVGQKLKTPKNPGP